MQTAMPVLMLQKAQEQALHSTGFVVKNCFIDEASPVQAARSRMLSAPPALRRTRHEFPAPSSSEDAVCDGDAKEEVLDSDDASTEAPPSPRDSVRRKTSVSSASSGVGERDVAEPGQDIPVGDMPAGVEELHSAIMNKCGFLRIVGASYRSRASKKLPVGSLMFFVAGLPGARRYRWLVPLRLSAARVLECCGYTCQVTVGTLFVSDPKGTFKVKVDFAPALFVQ